MKILQVTAALEQGGVERGTVEMAEFIVAQGAQSHVASQGGRLVDELLAAGSVHFALPLAKRDPLSIFYSAWRLANYIRQQKIDLVHARSRAPAWAAFIACRMTKKPMLTTFHGTHRIQNRAKKFYNSAMVRGKRVVAISEFIKRHIMENYAVVEELIDVAPRGFNPQAFSPDLVSGEERSAFRDKFALGQDEVIIALPGRLTRWKGQVLFLRSLAQIRELPWRALLIGGAGKKDAYEKELKQLVEELGLQQRVVFAGSQSDMALCYAGSDLVVSASTEPEAFGRVAVEAQAMERPVVASNHGGSLETVRDNETGWLFHSGSVDDLAAKLRDALSKHDSWQQMGQCARKWVLDNFTTEKMCRAEWQAYLKVLRSLDSHDC